MSQPSSSSLSLSLFSPSPSLSSASAHWSIGTINTRRPTQDILDRGHTEDKKDKEGHGDASQREKALYNNYYVSVLFFSYREAKAIGSFVFFTKVWCLLFLNNFWSIFTSFSKKFFSLLNVKAETRKVASLIIFFKVNVFPLRIFFFSLFQS